MTHKATKDTSGEFEMVELSNARVSAKIAVNIGNTLFSLRSQTEEILYFPFWLEEYKSTSKLAGIPFMHPWANRLEDDFILVEGQKYSFPESSKNLLTRDGNHLPMHGLLLKSDAWQTTMLEEDDNECSHAAELLFDKAAWLSIFPFKHSITMRHVLKENILTIETSVLNHDKKKMPISFGFHPYFLIDPEKRGNYLVTIPAEDVVIGDDKMIPISAIKKEDQWKFTKDQISLQNISFDHGFQKLKYTNGFAEFKLNDIKILMDENYTYAQIYAPDNREKPYVCIEPMTCATNAININQCKMIGEGEVYTASFSIAL